MRSLRALFLVLAGALLAITFGAPGCAGGDKAGGPRPGGNGGSSADSGVGGSGGLAATGAGVCLLNNCTMDAECEGCTFGRDKCKVDENRCVACFSQADCKTGEQCTSFGTCAPADLLCPTDGTGTPTITCSQDSDCLACDPQHQICDVTTSKCVACMIGNSQACTGNQNCSLTGKCEEKCPSGCTQDSDCLNCSNGGIQAFACMNHQCAECSPTMPCPQPGFQCEKGKCVKPCGAVGGQGADCQQDSECYGCGNNTGTTQWKCKLPINGGHGTCTVPASGCTDLAAKGAILPAPFDQVTNLCSDDTNCANVSIDFNVGKLIRDLIGSPEINLGIKQIKIQDAVIKYPMPTCASVELFDGKSCGVCVPCDDDGDCRPIGLDPLISQLFKGDPLAQLAASFLMDLLFGKGNDHSIHMQCQNVAAGYGACVPCANPLSACGTGSGTVGGGSCSHDKCETGGPLDPSCGLCERAVCAVDVFCCSKTWDTLCKKAVDIFCGDPCPGDPSCSQHNPCVEGAAMKKDCSTCTEKVCEIDPHCCDETTGSWDSFCTNLVLTDAVVKANCNGACPGPSSCPHSECVPGTPLTSACSECAKIVCAKDAWCCTPDKKWDAICADEAADEPKCPACPEN